MKIRKKPIGTLLCFLLAALILCLAFFLPDGEEGAAAGRTVVRVWHVDTFEGGKGSRASFLKAAARRAEKKGEVYYLVTAYTPEGAEQAAAEGDLPDAISFGVGVSAFAEWALPLPYSFAGGELGGKTRAYPWCRGGYALFSLTDSFGEEGTAAISSGGSNLPEAAAALSGIEGEVLPALTAYTAFLNGRYRYLLGTQRDICRFSARGVTVYEKPLPAYCDLYQYFSVLSAEKREEALALLCELLSEETQEALSSIGMYPVASGNVPQAEKTLSAFSSKEALAEIRALCAASPKNLGKYLKSI